LKDYEKSFSKPGVRYFKAIDENGYVCLAVLEIVAKRFATIALSSISQSYFTEAMIHINI
jgi:hypothetical protein